MCVRDGESKRGEEKGLRKREQERERDRESMRARALVCERETEQQNYQTKTHNWEQQRISNVD